MLIPCTHPTGAISNPATSRAIAEPFSAAI